MEDIAVVYLTSPAAKFVNGARLGSTVGTLRSQRGSSGAAARPDFVAF